MISLILMVNQPKATKSSINPLIPATHSSKAEIFILKAAMIYQSLCADITCCFSFSCLDFLLSLELLTKYSKKLLNYCLVLQLISTRFSDNWLLLQKKTKLRMRAVAKELLNFWPKYQVEGQAIGQQIHFNKKVKIFYASLSSLSTFYQGLSINFSPIFSFQKCLSNLLALN